MSKDKRESLIRRAIEEFFSIFPECQDKGFDRFMITNLREVYRVELYVDGKSYLHFMPKSA